MLSLLSWHFASEKLEKHRGKSGSSRSHGLQFAHYFSNNQRVTWNHFQTRPAPAPCTQTVLNRDSLMRFYYDH